MDCLRLDSAEIPVEWNNIGPGWTGGLQAVGTLNGKSDVNYPKYIIIINYTKVLKFLKWTKNSF